MKEMVNSMKESSHCSNGFISAWFLLVLLYVCTITMVVSINVSNTMATMENMEAYSRDFSRHALVIADVRCRLKNCTDEDGNIDVSPYVYNPSTHMISAYSGEDLILIEVNEEMTFIVSYTIIH